MCIVQGWFSPGQVFVLDEYCARYGVRGCHRHLSYLTDLLDYAEQATMIDPTLIHYSFAFCASHTHGNRSDQLVSAQHFQPIVLLHSMIGYWRNPVVRLSVCDAVHSESHGWCTGPKVTPACSSQACFLFVPSDTFSVAQDVSFSHKMHHKKSSRRNTCVLVYIHQAYLLLAA